MYKDDSHEVLCVDTFRFAEFMKFDSNYKPTQTSNEHFNYKTSVEKDVYAVFTNVAFALRIYLVIMLTNCKRLFSRLKTSMHDDRLHFFLFIMRIESNVLGFLLFDEVIVDFEGKKNKKSTKFIKRYLY